MAPPTPPPPPPPIFNTPFTVSPTDVGASPSFLTSGPSSSDRNSKLFESASGPSSANYVGSFLSSSTSPNSQGKLTRPDSAILSPGSFNHATPIFTPTLQSYSELAGIRVSDQDGSIIGGVEQGSAIYTPFLQKPQQISIFQPSFTLQQSRPIPSSQPAQAKTTPAAVFKTPRVWNILCHDILQDLRFCFCCGCCGSSKVNSNIGSKQMLQQQKHFRISICFLLGFLFLFFFFVCYLSWPRPVRFQWIQLGNITTSSDIKKTAGLTLLKPTTTSNLMDFAYLELFVNNDNYLPIPFTLNDIFAFPDQDVVVRSLSGTSSNVFTLAANKQNQIVSFPIQLVYKQVPQKCLNSHGSFELFVSVDGGWTWLASLWKPLVWKGSFYFPCPPSSK